MVSIDEELKLETLMTLSFLPSKRIFVIHQNKDSRKRSSSRAHVTCQGLASIRDSIIDFRPLLFSKGLNNLNYILYLALLMNGLKQFHELFRFRKNIQNSCVRIVKKKFSRIYLWNRHISWTKKKGGGENIVTMSLLSSNRLHTSLHVWLSKWDIMFLQQIISYLTRKEYSPLPHSALLKILILTVHNKIILKLTEKNVN